MLLTGEIKLSLPQRLFKAFVLTTSSWTGFYFIEPTGHGLPRSVFLFFKERAAGGDFPKHSCGRILPAEPAAHQLFHLRRGLCLAAPDTYTRRCTTRRLLGKQGSSAPLLNARKGFP